MPFTHLFQPLAMSMRGVLIFSNALENIVSTKSNAFLTEVTRDRREICANMSSHAGATYRKVVVCTGKI